MKKGLFLFNDVPPVSFIEDRQLNLTHRSTQNGR